MAVENDGTAFVSDHEFSVFWHHSPMNDCYFPSKLPHTDADVSAHAAQEWPPHREELGKGGPIARDVMSYMSFPVTPCAPPSRPRRAPRRAPHPAPRAPWAQGLGDQSTHCGTSLWQLSQLRVRVARAGSST